MEQSNSIQFFYDICGPTVYRWYNLFKETGSVHDKARSGRPMVTEVKFQEVEQKLDRSPNTSVRRVATQIGGVSHMDFSQVP